MPTGLKRQHRQPAATFRVRQICWLTLPATFLIILSITIWTAFASLKVPWPRSYVGSLRPANVLIPVHLPAEIPVKTILVEAGEVVKPGQTLVVLDKVEIESRLKEITQNIRVAKVQRRCIFNLGAGLEPAVKTRVLPSSDTVFPLQATELECEFKQSQARLTRNALAKRQTLLTDQLTLLEKRLALVVAQTSRQQQSQSERAAFAADALSIAHARNLVLMDVAEVETDLQSLSLNMKQAAIERSLAVSSEIEELSNYLKILGRFVSEPRLHAPVGGRILRVRSTGTADAFNTKVVLIEIEQSGSMEFTAAMYVPTRDAKTLKIGQAVKITALGMATGHQPLTGVIHSYSGDNNGKVTSRVLVRIRLSDASTLILQDARKGVAFHGAETASIIEVDIARRNLRTVFSETGRSALQSPTNLARLAAFVVSNFPANQASPTYAKRTLSED